MLEGQVILVTGAAKRIGRAIALDLAKAGARVAIHCNQSLDSARETAALCGSETPVFQADLSRVSEIHRLFDEVGNHFGGRLDALVNNAARFSRRDPLEVTEQDWDEIHDVNLKGLFFCCQAAAKLMLASRASAGAGQPRPGHIVNLSSLGGIKPWAFHAHYCASKAGVIHLTKSLAKAFAPRITVNSVAPGVIEFGPQPPTDPVVRRMISQTPAQRAGSGDEIAEAVRYFLTSSSFVTGQTLVVDGGLSLR